MASNETILILSNDTVSIFLPIGGDSYTYDIISSLVRVLHKKVTSYRYLKVFPPLRRVFNPAKDAHASQGKLNCLGTRNEAEVKQDGIMIKIATVFANNQ